MKIAIIYDVIYPFVKGGAEKRIYKLARHLGRNHQVHLFGMKYWSGPDEIQFENFFLHGVCSARNLYNSWGERNFFEPLYFSGHLFWTLKNFDFDLIDCQNFPYFPSWVAAFWAWRKKRPLVLTWLEVWDKYWFRHLGFFKGLVGYLVEKITGRLSRFNTAISYHTGRKILRFLKNKDVKLIPIGINFQKIAEVPAAEKKSDLIFAGRLTKEKNIDLLLKIIQKTGLTCVIIGDGPEKKSLEELTQKLEVAGRVKFLGFLENQEEVYSHLKASRILILPSSREGFSTVTLEAFAAGLPVVTGNSPDNAAKDLVEASGFGLVAEPSPADFIEKINQILADDFFKNKIAAEAEKFLKKYEIEFVASRLENFYKRVALLNSSRISGRKGLSRRDCIK